MKAQDQRLLNKPTLEESLNIRKISKIDHRLTIQNERLNRDFSIQQNMILFRKIAKTTINTINKIEKNV